MTWRLELLDDARDDLKKLDRKDAERILEFLHKRVEALNTPRAIGEALQGERFKDLWRYRVGDFRILANIEDHVSLVYVVKIAHRKEAYR